MRGDDRVGEPVPEHQPRAGDAHSGCGTAGMRCVHSIDCRRSAEIELATHDKRPWNMRPATYRQSGRAAAIAASHINHRSVRSRGFRRDDVSSCHAEISDAPGYRAGCCPHGCVLWWRERGARRAPESHLWELPGTGSSGELRAGRRPATTIHRRPDPSRQPFGRLRGRADAVRAGRRSWPTDRLDERGRAGHVPAGARNRPRRTIDGPTGDLAIKGPGRLRDRRRELPHSQGRGSSVSLRG